MFYGYNVVNGTAPMYLVGLVHTHKPVRHLQLEFESPLRVPKTQIAILGKTSFHASAFNLWNDFLIKLDLNYSVRFLKPSCVR